MHAYIHAHKHTYVRTYIHTYSLAGVEQLPETLGGSPGWLLCWPTSGHDDDRSTRAIPASLLRDVVLVIHASRLRVKSLTPAMWQSRLAALLATHAECFGHS